MYIYNQQKPVLPYVYRCTERGTGKFYIGYRYKNTVPSSEDLGIHYFTSNEYVKSNFHNFDFEIISEFADRKEAFTFETKLIKETKSEHQINANKHNKTKSKYNKSTINEYCLFPDCGKYINSSIKRFCCRTHAAKYSALRGHNKI